MVSASDLKVYKTTNNLGGAITATSINTGTPNNLFSNVPNNERVTGEDYYACVYFKNTHASEAMDNFQLWLSDKSFPHDTEIKWGFDPIANTTIFFDGINDLVNCGNHSDLWSQGLTKFSFSFWIHSTLGWDGSDRAVVRHGSGAHSFRCYIDGSIANRITFEVANSVSVASNSRSSIFTLNEWNHIVCVYDNSLGSANLKIYRNSVVGTFTANLTETITKSDDLTLSASTTDFKGYMRDFRFWKSKALTQTEINDVYADNDSAPDPDYHLRMTEGSGKPLDSISATKTGTLTGAVWNTSAITIADKYTAPSNVTWNLLGGAPQIIPITPSIPSYHFEPYYSFNGTDIDIISIPDSAALDLVQFSIACWFRTTKNYVPDPLGGEGMMCMKGGWITNDPGEQLSYGLWVSDANHLRGGFEETDGTDHICTTTGTTVNDGNWHLGCVTYDGANVRIYLDGSEKLTASAPHATSATPESNAQDLTLGKISLPDKEGYYTGDLDEVYVWNNDLTAGEIAALFSAGTVPQTGNLVYSNTFGTSTTFQANSSAGSLASSTSFPIWIWYHVNANALSRIDDSELFSFRFDIPQGGTGSGGGSGEEGGGGGTGGNPPPASTDYKIAYAADWGCESETDDVIDLIKNGGYDIVVGGGDNAYSSADCWISRFNSLKSKFPISAYGNHEYSESGGTAPYKTFFGRSQTYYTYKFQNILFIVIDSNINMDSGSTQNTTLKNAITASLTDNTITWRIAIIHHPWFGADSDHSYNDGNSVQAFHSFFQNNKVSFVLSAHNHNWQRSFQVAYNSGNPESPTVVDNTAPFSRNTLGLIHVISGTGGHDSGSSLYALGSQPSFQAYQNRTHNGIWEIVASNNGQTLTCSFVDIGGAKFDTFIINA